MEGYTADAIAQGLQLPVNSSPVRNLLEFSERRAWGPSDLKTPNDTAGWSPKEQRHVAG